MCFGRSGGLALYGKPTTIPVSGLRGVVAYLAPVLALHLSFAMEGTCMFTTKPESGGNDQSGGGVSDAEERPWPRSQVGWGALVRDAKTYSPTERPATYLFRAKPVPSRGSHRSGGGLTVRGGGTGLLKARSKSTVGSEGDIRCGSLLLGGDRR